MGGNIMSNTGDLIIDTWDDRFIPTGQDGIEISNGDSVERIEDKYTDVTDKIVYSKDLGTFEQTLKNIDDDPELDPVTEVHIHVETGDGHNYIHFEYPGGTGFSLRLPTIVRNYTRSEWLEFKHGNAEEQS